MSEEIGFMKEAARRGVSPIALFVGDRPCLGARLFRWMQPVPANRPCHDRTKEFVGRGELPPAFHPRNVLRIAALTVVLKTYIDRLSFSFTEYCATRGFIPTETASMDPQELLPLPRASELA